MKPRDAACLIGIPLCAMDDVARGERVSTFTLAGVSRHIAGYVHSSLYEPALQIARCKVDSLIKAACALMSPVNFTKALVN